MNEHELTDIASVLCPEQRQLAQSSRCRGKEGRRPVEAAEAGEEHPTRQRDEHEKRDQREDRLPPMHHGTRDLRGEGASGHDPNDGSGGIAGGIRQLPLKSGHGDDGSGRQRPKRPRQRKPSHLKTAPPAQPETKPRRARTARRRQVYLSSLAPAPRTGPLHAVECRPQPCPASIGKRDRNWRSFRSFRPSVPGQDRSASTARSFRGS